MDAVEGERVELTAYERRALGEIDAWKRRTRTAGSDGGPGLVGRALRRLPGVDALSRVRPPTLPPGVQANLDRAVRAALDRSNVAAQGTIDLDAVRARVAGISDLEQLDDLVRPLHARYVTIARVEGAVAGGVPVLAGPALLPALVAALAADVAVLLGLSLRAVSETLAHYGVDVTAEEEQLYAVQVLGVAFAGDDATRTALLANTTRLGRALTTRVLLTESMERFAVIRLTRRILERLGISAAQGKAGQLVPIAGALVGAQVNAAFLERVTEAAAMLGRERHLLRRHVPDGADVPADLLGDVAEAFGVDLAAS